MNEGCVLIISKFPLLRPADTVQDIVKAVASFTLVYVGTRLNPESSFCKLYRVNFCKLYSLQNMWSTYLTIHLRIRGVVTMTLRIKVLKELINFLRLEDIIDLLI